MFNPDIRDKLDSHLKTRKTSECTFALVPIMRSAKSSTYIRGTAQDSAAEDNTMVVKPSTQRFFGTGVWIDKQLAKIQPSFAHHGAKQPNTAL